MAESVGIHWVKTPDELSRAIEQFGIKVLVVTHAGASSVGVKMQNHARRHAPWEDRTGNARGGLFFVVDGFGMEQKVGKAHPGSKPGASAAFKRDRKLEQVEGGDQLTLVVLLGHTMFYGANLELDHGQRYAIVWLTITGIGIPEMQKMLNNLFDKVK